MRGPKFVVRRTTLAVAEDLCVRYHGYGSIGRSATYAFAVLEDDVAVAVYVFQPPPPGAARAVCPEAPHGVLALSRMVAVPRGERALAHVSKPLRRIMRQEIDRGRWPVLITYSDEGQGHTGHVYKCSGWQPTVRSKRPFFVDGEGRRASSYSNGKHGGRELRRGGDTFVQRWEHWACERGAAGAHIEAAGWIRVPVEGKRWRSGNSAHTFVLRPPNPPAGPA